MVLHSDTPPQPLGSAFQHSRSYRLRSRRKRSHSDQPRGLDSRFNQASRLVRFFHAHEAHSLDSIVEHPEDVSNRGFDAPIFFPMSQRLTKAKTMACLADFSEGSQKEMGMTEDDHETSSDPSPIQDRQPVSISEYSENHEEEEDDDWEF